MRSVESTEIVEKTDMSDYTEGNAQVISRHCAIVRYAEPRMCRTMADIAEWRTIGG